MSWQKVRLDAVADLCLGKMLDKKKNKGNLLPYLANINVRWGTLELEELREMRFEDRELERYGLRSGDIVMCEGGEPGRCVLWRDQVPGMMIQKALHRIRSLEGVDSEFLFYSLFHMGRSGQLEQHFTGATIKHLPGERLARVELTLPSLETQQRIAAILGAYDDLIEVNRRRVAVLEEMARGLFEEWFVRFRFPGHEDVPIVDTPDGPLPEGWGFVPLSDVLYLHYGKALKKSDRVEGDVSVIGSSGIVGSHVEAYVDAPGIVVGRKGNVGSVVWSPKPFWPIDTTYFVETKLPLAYVRELLERVPFQNTDAAVPGLNRDYAHSRKVVAPRLELIERYGAFVDEVTEQVDLLGQMNNRLAASRDLLLPRLISGQLSVEAAECQMENAA